MKRMYWFYSLVCIFLIGCDKPSTKSMGSLLSPTASDETQSGFAKVKKGVGIVFPDDHRAHNEFRHEWWYLTANLIDDKGQALGIQWTQFRFATSPPSANVHQAASSWQSQQIYMAHSAVTTKDQHLAAEKWSREHPDLAGIESQPFRAYLDDWQWLSSTKDLFPATLNVKAKRFEYSLTLKTNAPYHKQGDNGFSTKSQDGKVASYYYSQPFIKVTGEVTIDGKQHQVSGTGWIDREWSSQFLLDSQQGWDWFAIRLSNSESLIVFQLRDSNTGKASYQQAKIMRSNGENAIIDSEDIHLRSSAYTEISDRTYPTEWQLAIPSQNIDLVLSALNPSAKMPLTIPYWEGPIIIKGSHRAEGYMELTGY